MTHELNPGDVISPSGLITSSSHAVSNSSSTVSNKTTQHALKLLFPWLLGVTAGIVLLIGVGQSVHEQHINHQVAVAAQRAVALANEGKPSPAPATIKPTVSAVASYNVAPDMPKYLMIPELNVNARIYSVGLTNSGAIGTPDNVYDTDWYDGSSLPGQPGAMLIDGHVSSWTTNGVFYGIKSLRAGDVLQVERGDGTVITYRVVASKVYSADNVDMTAALSPIVPGKPGLNLITCTGAVVAGTNDFNERVVVFAEEVI
jgi:LPXTG-site transpeptidase (sortase) family protein